MDGAVEVKLSAYFDVLGWWVRVVAIEMNQKLDGASVGVWMKRVPRPVSPAGPPSECPPVLDLRIGALLVFPDEHPGEHFVVQSFRRAVNLEESSLYLWASDVLLSQTIVDTERNRRESLAASARVFPRLERQMDEGEAN